MSHSDPDATPSDTKEAIMQATYRAICEHGYANLTMEAIADEFDMTKAVLHYHYDTKEKLLVAFLEYLLEEFDGHNVVDEIDSPPERLEALVDRLLYGPEERQDDAVFSHWDFHSALTEIRTQALHNEAYREQLTVNVAAIEAMIADVLRDGIDRGVFREVDPERTATFLLATITGARTYQLTLDRTDVADATRLQLDEYINGWLVRPDGDAAARGGNETTTSVGVEPE